MAHTTEHPETTNLCLCSCGQTANRKFRQGHDARLVSKLVEATISGELTSLHADLLDTDAEAFYGSVLQQRIDWTFIGLNRRVSDRLADKFHNAIKRATSGKAKARRAKRDNGPRVGDTVRVKVGRWAYDNAKVAAADDVTGRVTLVEFTDRKGEVRTSDNFQVLPALGR